MIDLFTIMRKNKVMLLILLFMFIKGIAWALITPPFQAPDEGSHFTYVQYIAEENKPPVITDDAYGNSKELGEFLAREKLVPLQYDKTVKALHITETFHLFDDDPFTIEDRKASGSTIVSGYPPLYYFLAGLFYKIFYFSSIVDRFYAVRFFSILLSLVTIWLAYKIGKKVKPDSELFAASLALMVGLQPMFSMVSIAVTSDNLLNLFAAAMIYWILCLTEKITTRKIVIGGIINGFGMLIKPTSVFVIGFISLLVLILVIKNKVPLKRTMKLAALYVIPTVIIFLPWSIFSFMHYQSLSGTIAFQPQGDPALTLGWYLENNFFSKEAIFRIYNLWIKSYWANFAWLNLIFESIWIYKLLFLIVITAVIGTTMSLIRKKETMNYIGISLIYVIANVVFLYIVELVYFNKQQMYMLQGRYLLTALIPISIVLLQGSGCLFGKHKNHVYVVMVACMILFNLASIELIFRRFY